QQTADQRDLHSFPTRRSSDLGAGTFQPVKEEDVAQHPMHSEQIVIHQDNVKRLLHHDGNIVAVGTTSMRSLESLYWYGVKLLERSEEHTSELQSRENLVCRLL